MQLFNLCHLFIFQKKIGPNYINLQKRNTTAIVKGLIAHMYTFCSFFFFLILNTRYDEQMGWQKTEWLFFRTSNLFLWTKNFFRRAVKNWIFRTWFILWKEKKKVREKNGKVGGIKLINAWICNSCIMKEKVNYK